MTTPEILRAARVTLDQALAIDWPTLHLVDEMKNLLIGQVWAESRCGSTKDWGTSNNWGAVTYHKGDGKVIEHADHDANGKPVVYRFQAYDTQLEAARDWLRVLLRGGVPKALASGSARELAAAMYANHYYTGTSGTADDRIVAYTSLILQSASFVRSILEGARLQERLLAAGYDPHGIDGIVGLMTRNALRAFQAAHGLHADGILTDATRQALEEATPTLRELPDAGPPSDPPPA